MTQRRHEMPFGATVTSDGVSFSLFAPDVSHVELMLQGRAPVPMEADGAWKTIHVSDAAAGDLYQFRLPGGLLIPDPASRFQPHGVIGPSQVIDPRAYEWNDPAWIGRPWAETVLYEAHVGTATTEGTYASFARRIDQLAAIGITAVELLPVSQWRGDRNWGYDGVLPFAPASAYGAPDDLRALIDRAHALGVMIIMDVVYNHFGPSGNYLHSYASSFFTERHLTPWGAAVNFDGEESEHARSYFINNALYWVREFNVDSLRLDAVHAIHDESPRHILSEIATEVRAISGDRHVHLILENDNNEAHWLKRDNDGVSAPLYTAQWNDDAHHCWHTLLTGERDGYYKDFADKAPERLGRSLAEGFVYQDDVSTFRNGERRGEPSAHLHPGAFIDFLQNHDQVGNRALGERIDALVDPEKLAVARAVLLLSPHIPMLFMGEEIAAQNPFQYFVDFAEEPELAEAVRTGRAREFKSFSSFGASQSQRLPDPNSVETFERSKLDCAEEKDAGCLEATRKITQLISLRREHIVPIVASRFLGSNYSTTNGSLIDVTWRFEAGALRLLLNTGMVEAEIVAAKWRQVYASDAAEFLSARAMLPSWSMVMMRSEQ
jgi:maltooligosyltrehalose trehalohydrolase